MQAQSPPAMEFFQSLLKGSGMSSSFANWMAPTLDPDELERKIVDLRVVLQWLEANVRLTQATIQGLEVQRMTLSTLRTMNVDFGDLASHLGSAMRAGAEAMGAAAHMADSAPPAPPAAPTAQGPGAEAEAEPARRAPAPGDAAPMGGIIDPMQWWSTLSEQFTKVATEALRDSAWAMPAGAAPAAGASAGAGASASAGAPSAASSGAPPRAASKAPAARKRAAAGAGSKAGSKAGAKPGAAARKAPASRTR